MKTIIGGAIAVLLGVFSFSIFFTSFLKLLAASLPVLFIMGGALAVYLGFDSLKSDSQEELYTSDDIETNEEPIVEEPVLEEPVLEEPVLEEPVVEEPVVEEPVVEEPVAEEPVVEEPVAEEPVAEEPVVEEPVAEEPVAEEPVVEKAVVEEPVAEETVELVGNTESNVFHTRGCKFSKSKKCTATFANREDAITEGYKPCGVCKP